MNVYGITDRGLVRQQNQDTFYVWSDHQTALVLVCDGMGGAKAGNVASALAAEQFVEQVCHAHETIKERLRHALSEANGAVYRRAHTEPSCSGMGTTLVAAFAQEDHACVINVGDSRAYYLSKAGVRQITRDHSLVWELMERGQITEEEAKHHPNRNIITRALGTSPDLIGDIFELELEPDSLLLLCSDGLSNMVEAEEMLQIWRTSPQITECCQQLVALAIQRGAPDNVTVAVLQTAAASGSGEGAE
jgi:protein phosphatase